MTKLSSPFGKGNTSVRSEEPLSDDQIRLVAPSVFAERPHCSRSEHYGYFPTYQVVQKLREEGFDPFMACQTNSRIEGKSDFTKHMLRFRQSGQINSDTANEIILLNSHDGTSSYRMLAGTFRFVCQNGLIRGNTVNDLTLRHSGNIMDLIIEAAFQIITEFEAIEAHKELMKSVVLTIPQQTSFAEQALLLKYKGNESPFKPVAVNLPRRIEDVGDDLWATFNRVQENLVKGGMVGYNANNKKVTARNITNLKADIRINKGLWQLAESMINQ